MDKTPAAAGDEIAQQNPMPASAAEIMVRKSDAQPRPPPIGHTRTKSLDRSQRLARRALRACVATLCLAPLVGGWLVDHCPLRFRFPDAAAVVAQWEKADPPPDVVLLGSSRFVDGVDSYQLQSETKQLVPDMPLSIFNGAISGAEPITVEFITRQLFQSRSLTPRLVILEAAADLLGRDNRPYKMLVTRQFTAADLPHYAGDIIEHGAISRLASSRLTPFYLHRGALIDWLGDEIRAWVGMKTNRVPIPKPSTVDPAQPEQQLRNAMRGFATHLRHSELAGTTSMAFEKTVARLRSRGCYVVLLEPPLPAAQRNFFSQGLEMQFHEFIEQLCKDYGCHFIDYSQRLPDELFRDNQHANGQGRVTFTRLLARDVIAPFCNQLDLNRGTAGRD